MPEKPIPEQDPITGKSYALHYMVATVILVATLFWALWDEAWGQRPWKEFQDQWKGRYSAFLNTARSKSVTSEKDVEQNPDYAALKQAYDKANQDSKAQAEEARKKLDDASARLLAVQSVFTDRRAYVNALTYEYETSTSNSAKASKKKDIDAYKAEQATVEFPDGTKKKFNFQQLEETYNEIRDERTKLSLELGDILKPVTAAKAKMDEYITDHMVDLTPSQIAGLKKRATEWDPAIVQINVAEANIVDRCESCHMNTREPIKVTEAAMMAKGEKKPDEYARRFRRVIPSRNCCRFTIPKNLAVHHATKEMVALPRASRRRMATTSTGCGRFILKRIRRPAARVVTLPTWCSRVAMCNGTPSTMGKIYSGSGAAWAATAMRAMTRSPRISTPSPSRLSRLKPRRKTTSSRTAYMMKQAGRRFIERRKPTNSMAKPWTCKVANSKLDARLQQLDFQSHSLMQDQKKVGPNLKDVRLKLNKNWIPVWLKKPSDFRPTTKMPNFRLTDHQIQAISAYIWQSGFTDALPKHKPGNAAHGKELFETRGCLACHSIGEGDQMQGGVFSANLTRIGEKANYDYLVRWIHNARERTRPYCPYEKERHWSRGLREEGTALPVRSGSQQVPE